MRMTSFCLAAALLLALSPIAAATSDTVPAAGGVIEVTPIHHGSVELTYGGKVIYVDPWSEGDYTDAPQADLILVTDIHGDHLDPEMIARLRKDDTALVVPQAAAEKVEGETVLENGDSQTIAGVQIEAVPMYNLKRGPEEGKLYHDKGRGNGYILTLGGKRLYFAGDTECTPEMRGLENIDVAFVPMNLPYTMTPAEAAECVRAFAPKVVYPYHYRGSELWEFSEPLKSSPGIEVRLRAWYEGEP